MLDVLRSASHIVVVVFGLLGAACSQGLEQVPGPEDDSLLSGLPGCVVVGGGQGRIVSVRLKDLNQRMVRSPGQPGGGVHAVAGPDQAGRIVFVENYMSEKRHSLTVLTADGTELVRIGRAGDALGDHAIGYDLALSPRGSVMAFVGKNVTRHLGPNSSEPAAFVAYGPLELVELDSRRSRTTGMYALDRGMAFLPDGYRLVYTALMSRQQLDPELLRRMMGGEFAGWEMVPVVMLLDTRTGTTTRLRVGWRPVPTPDGDAILVSNDRKEYILLSLSTGAEQTIRFPGDWAGPIAFVRRDVLLYWGLPTAGSAPQWTGDNSPLVGRKPMGTLKVADIRTGKFKTVLSPVDPRWQVSFGPCGPS